jgi:hypothetical protein
MDVSLDAFGTENQDPSTRYSHQDSKKNVRTSEDSSPLKAEMERIKKEAFSKEKDYKSQI